MRGLYNQSNNSLNCELSNQLVQKERVQSAKRLEELVKEQRGKLDELREQYDISQQQVDGLQVCILYVLKINRQRVKLIR